MARRTWIGLGEVSLRRATVEEKDAANCAQFPATEARPRSTSLARTERGASLRRLALQHPHQHRRLAPQLFQLVILARIGGEEVDDHVAIIQDRPAAALDAKTLGVQGTDVLLDFELFQEQVLDGLGLALVVDGGNDEIVGDAGEFVDVEQDNVGALPVLDNVYNLACQGNAVQRFLLDEKTRVTTAKFADRILASAWAASQWNGIRLGD